MVKIMCDGIFYSNSNNFSTRAEAWMVSIRAWQSAYASLKAGMCSEFSGSAGGESILRVLIGVPFYHTRKSRCGPVERPVEPTYPITCP